MQYQNLRNAYLNQEKWIFQGVGELGIPPLPAVDVPLLDSTRGMINAEAISQMKNGVVLINMARDLLVDEKAVVEAIDEGKIRLFRNAFPFR